MFDYDDRKAKARRDADRKRDRQIKRRSIFCGVNIEPTHEIVADFISTDEDETVAELMHRFRLNERE